jgi:cell division protease FtsH
MDGFEGNEGIILVAATNRPDVLDPALLRPGRFDRQVIVPRPDVRGREKILEIHSKKKPISSEVNLGIIAKGTAGFSGADLANLLNESALLAARENKDEITINHLEMAKDKVLMGVERKSMIISDKEKFNTAFHESGHALMGKKLEGSDSDVVHKVSIIPRGRALGVTIQLPDEDRLSATVNWCNNRIQILLAGRIAEVLSVGDNFTSGASNDLKVATSIVKSMVTEWGMGNMPLISYTSNDQEIFLGREVTKHQNLSNGTITKIDNEIERIITENYNIAKEYLSNNYDKLLVMSQVLMEMETIGSDIIDRIYEGETTVQILGSEEALKWTPEYFNNTKKDI